MRSVSVFARHTITAAMPRPSGAEWRHRTKPAHRLDALALLFVGCVSSYDHQTEDERMDDAAQEIAAGIDMTGLDALQ